MNLTPILLNHNQFPQTDLKYQPLRKNISKSKQKPIHKQINTVSLVSRRLQSLSPQQTQLIKNNTYIPVNCRLKVTSNQQKQKNALNKKYFAIDYQQKMLSKPISPNTFQKLPKNQKIQIIYEYNCPNGERLENNHENLTQSKKIIQNRQNYQLKNQQEALQYSRHQKNTNSNYIANNDYEIRSNPNELIRNGISPSGHEGVHNLNIISGQNIRNSNSNKNQANRGSKIGPTAHRDVSSQKNSKLALSNSNKVITYGPTTLGGQGNRNTLSNSSNKLRDSTSPNRMRNSQKNISNAQGNIYNQQHRTGGYPYVANDDNQYTSTGYQFIANGDDEILSGPAFFQTQGRMKYNQMGHTSKQQYENRSKRQPRSGNIEIGGRTKSNTRHTGDFQLNIGINSRHRQKNMGSTKDFSGHLGKQDPLDILQTEVKGEYYVERDEEGQQQRSKMRDYVQKVQSRIIIGNDGRNSTGNLNDANFRNRKKVQMSRQSNTVNAQSSPISPEILQRSKKVQQYQNTGGRGYNFKKNEQNDPKRKKQDYKYNLYSMCDQQFNLKCKTGLFTPNQICASQPKRQGWN